MIRELSLLRSVKTGKGLQKLITNLARQRKTQKQSGRKRSRLSKRDREEILGKTDGRCHICGCDLTLSTFQADHVKSHSAGGEHKIDNYLPSCFTCNNYRWHYSSEEIQLILKLGVWLKGRINRGNSDDLELANLFMKHQLSLRKRTRKVVGR